MLDRRFVRENPDSVRAALAKRHIEFDLDRLLAIDSRLLENARDRDDLKAEQNRLSKAVPTLQGDDKQAAIDREVSRKCDIEQSGIHCRRIQIDRTRDEHGLRGRVARIV